MNRLLAVILALSGLLALGYARATPVGGAPDEAAHLQYVRVLATQGRLPALDLTRQRDSYDDPDYESHQSPLYYTLAVPFFLAGRAMGGEDGAALGCRLLSILISLVGVGLVWRIGREIAPARPAFSLAAAGFAAFLPMRLAVSASISNDGLAEVTSSAALLVMLRALRGPWGARQAAVLGASVAAALLSKQSAIVLLPPALAAIYLASRGADSASEAPARSDAGLSPEGLRRFLVTGSVMAGVTFVLSGWWFARNHAVYGDPLGQSAFNWYFADTPRWINFRDTGWSFATYLGKLVLPTTFASFWGAFGHLQPDRPDLFLGWYRRDTDWWTPLADGLQFLWPRAGFLPRSWVYPLLVLALAASLAGGVWAYLRWRRGGRAAPDPVIAAGAGILALHAVFVVAVFFNFNSTYFQAQGRYLFPAIAAIALALSAGWLEWGRKREVAVACGIVGLELALAVYGLFGVVQPAFAS